MKRMNSSQSHNWPFPQLAAITKSVSPCIPALVGLGFAAWFPELHDGGLQLPKRPIPSHTNHTQTPSLRMSCFIMINLVNRERCSFHCFLTIPYFVCLFVFTHVFSTRLRDVGSGMTRSFIFVPPT